jgi:predicted homoserine dehydrogenase-like protein
MPELAPVTMATRSSKLYDDTTAVRVAIVGAGLMGAQIVCGLGDESDRAS